MANNTTYKELGHLEGVLQFMSRHERLADALVVLGAIALACSVLS